MVVFVHVCLEVVDSYVMFACQGSVEPTRYDVCDVYAGCGDWFVAGGSFFCKLICNFVA